MPPLDMPNVIVLDDDFVADQRPKLYTKKPQTPMADRTELLPTYSMDLKPCASVRFLLTVVHDPADKRVVELHEGNIISIGRSSKTTSIPESPYRVSFRNPIVSRQHATLRLSSDRTKVMLTDQNSLHGTYVGDRRLEPFEKCHVLSGDILRFGSMVTKGQEAHSGVAVLFERLDTITPPRTPATRPPVGFRVPSDSEESDIEHDADSICEVEPPTSSAMITPKRNQDPEIPTSDDLERYSWELDPDDLELLESPDAASSQSILVSEGSRGVFRLDEVQLNNPVVPKVLIDQRAQPEAVSEDEAPEIMSSKRAESIDLGHPDTEVVQARDLDWKEHNDNVGKTNEHEHNAPGGQDSQGTAASMPEEPKIVQDSFVPAMTFVLGEVPESIQQWEDWQFDGKEKLKISSLMEPTEPIMDKADGDKNTIDHGSNIHKDGHNRLEVVQRILEECPQMTSCVVELPETRSGKKRKANDTDEASANAPHSSAGRSRKRAKVVRKRSYMPLTTFIGGAAFGIVSTVTFLGSDVCGKLLEWHASL